MCICIYVCIYIYMCVYIYIYIYIYMQYYFSSRSGIGRRDARRHAIRTPVWQKYIYIYIYIYIYCFTFCFRHRYREIQWVKKGIDRQAADRQITIPFFYPLLCGGYTCMGVLIGKYRVRYIYIYIYIYTYICIQIDKLIDRQIDRYIMGHHGLFLTTDHNIWLPEGGPRGCAGLNISAPGDRTLRKSGRCPMVGRYAPLGFQKSLATQLVIRPIFILRILRPRIFESKFRNHCTKKLDGALRKSTSFV